MTSTNYCSKTYLESDFKVLQSIYSCHNISFVKEYKSPSWSGFILQFRKMVLCLILYSKFIQYFFILYLEVLCLLNNSNILWQWLPNSFQKMTHASASLFLQHKNFPKLFSSLPLEMHSKFLIPTFNIHHFVWNPTFLQLHSMHFWKR